MAESLEQICLVEKGVPLYQYLLENNHLTSSSLAFRLGVCGDTVQRYAKAYGIKLKSNRLNRLAYGRQVL